MSPAFIYFIKINTALILFYGFYRLFFRKDTFFQLRRLLLLGFFILGILYPFLNIQEWITQQEPIKEVIQVYTAILPEVVLQSGTSENMTHDWKEIVSLIIGFIYIAGVIVLSGRFLIQFGSIIRIKIKSTLKKINGVDIYVPEKPAGPFSFFHWIFIHPDSHSCDEMEEILTHELTHTRQWHSIDVIISELTSIACWFNPCVWSLRKEVRYNLEYLADNKVLECGYDSKSYQYHLLGLAHQQSGAALYNNFNVLHLKDRIRMMNKERSHNISRTKYLLFIPLAGVLLLISNIESISRIPDFGKLLVINEQGKNIFSLENIQGFTTFPSLFPIMNDENSDEPVITPPLAPEIEKYMTEQVFTVVESMPSFPGGDRELLKYINRNVKYPLIAQEMGIQGRVVITFTIGKEGDISDVEVVRGIDPSLDQEAVRVTKNMPTWNPGMQRNEPVAVKYTLPIVFRLA